MNFRLTEWVWKRSLTTIPDDRLLLLAIAAEAGQDGFSRAGLVALAARMRRHLTAVRRGLIRLADADAIWIARYNEFRMGLLERAPFELSIAINTRGAKCGPTITGRGNDVTQRPPTQAQPLALVSPPAKAARSTQPISKSLSRILRILAERPEGMTRKNLAIRAGVNENSGFFERRLRELRDQRWVATLGPNDQVRQITELGLAALGPYTPIASIDAVLKHWIGALGDGASRMLATIAAIHPKGMTTAQLGKELQRIPESTAFVVDLANLRSKALVSEGADGWVASEELFR